MKLIEDERGSLTVRLFPEEAELLSHALRDAGHCAPTPEGNAYLRAVATALEIFTIVGFHELGQPRESGPPASVGALS